MCHCVNNRVGYLHRILGDRPDLLSCFQRFDTSVDETLCQILQVSDTESNIRQVSVIRSGLVVDSALITCHTGPVGVKGKVTYYTASKFLSFFKNLIGFIASWLPSQYHRVPTGCNSFIHSFSERMKELTNMMNGDERNLVALCSERNFSESQINKYAEQLKSFKNEERQHFRFQLMKVVFDQYPLQ